MDPDLILREPPPLDPAWLAHEQASGLLLPRPVTTDPAKRQKAYSDTCKTLNAMLLTGRDKDLNNGLEIRDCTIKSPDSKLSIPIRYYTPANKQDEDTAIYYHGGGLYVGDLDSEDLSCRRICKALQCTVYSVDYRLMPQYTADDALADALSAFHIISQKRQNGKLVLMGSSSGGQLAAQVSQLARGKGRMVDGVLLRGPVTCDAANLPSRLKESHTSMAPAFHTSLLSGPALTAENRTELKLPLEGEELKGLPRHWVQVCTNDIYYSDGMCYAAGLQEQGVEVKTDVLWGWPHTFWLKAPLLERAIEAEENMLEGMRWSLER